jgi:hypothetical protein
MANIAMNFPLFRQPFVRLDAWDFPVAVFSTISRAQEEETRALRKTYWTFSKIDQRSLESPPT